MASINTSSIVSTAAHHKEDERKKVYTSFSHQGKSVCACVGVKQLKDLIKSLKENGNRLTPRAHGNTKRILQ